MTEDFDLQKALAARSTTPTEERDACPECYRATLNVRVGGSESRGGPELKGEGRYRCHECGWHGDDPITMAEAAELREARSLSSEQQ